MAVVPMQRITIYGLKRDRKSILEALQRKGALEIADSKVPDDVAFREDTSAAQATFYKAAANAENSIGILDQYSPETKPKKELFSGRKTLSADEYYSFVGETEEIMRIAALVSSWSKEISEYSAQITRNEASAEALEPWLDLPVPVSFKGTKKTAALIGSIPEKLDEEAVYSMYMEAVEKAGLERDLYPADITVISSLPEQTFIFVLCLSRQAREIEEAFRSIGFSRPLYAPKKPAREAMAELIAENKRLENEIKIRQNKIQSCAGMRSAFKFMADYYTMRAEKYNVLGRLAQMRRTFVLEGYIPAAEAEKLETEFSRKYDVAIEIESAAEDEGAPVLLSNNAFAAPMEPVLETYSLPSKGEIDPSFAMAMFYYILFGLMLSDAAYGAIMAGACGFILAKFKNIEDSLKKTLKMFLYCGISTIFWGVMFGGYFGDVVSVVSETFFGHEIVIPPLWFAPLDAPMQMLVFSFAVGIVHLFTGLGIQFYQLWKKKMYKDAIYDVVFWYMLVGGAIVYLLTVPMFIQMTGISFILPPVAGTISAAAAVLGAVGIILTGGRESKNPVKRLLKGAYALYNVTGYLSDILSYSRLLALGLATGVIAEVFNKMGSMFGGGVIGFILFLLVFVVGHSLNIGINVLGAYVHTNRLQFVEFFGKFYEGGGRKYKPYAVNTKYFKIREDT